MIQWHFYKNHIVLKFWLQGIECSRHSTLYSLLISFDTTLKFFHICMIFYFCIFSSVYCLQLQMTFLSLHSWVYWLAFTFSLRYNLHEEKFKNLKFIFFSRRYCNNQKPICKKINLDPYLLPHRKLNTK